jgi:hypothetical protein
MDDLTPLAVIDSFFSSDEIQPVYERETEIPMFASDIAELVGIVLTHFEASMPEGRQLNMAKSLTKKDMWQWWNRRFERVETGRKDAGYMGHRNDVY